MDDAGRGSMLGPLVIAGVSVRKSEARGLTSMGVRDSKKLSAAKREILYRKILRYVDGYYVAKITPKTIDRSVEKHLLNRLEAKYMARVITKLDSDVSYVDSCDVNNARFGREVSRLSGHRVRSYHHADDRFVIVSAASILAKVVRDREVAKLGGRQEIGSGYPSDVRTVRFVRRCVRRDGKVPPFVRTSWRPVKKIMRDCR